MVSVGEEAPEFEAPLANGEVEAAAAAAD